MLPLPDRPGLGVELDRDALASYAAEAERVVRGSTWWADPAPGVAATIGGWPRRRRSGPRDDIVGLVHRGAGVREFSLAAGRILARAVPFDGVCVLTLDPATLLPTGDVVENALPPDATRGMAAIEIAGATSTPSRRWRAPRRRPRR